MKVFACPEEVPAPEMVVTNFDFAAWRKMEDEHQLRLKAWLIERGYRGKHTGDILAVPYADSYAYYMFADGPKACLIHLPYGDAWDSPDVQFLPKKEVLRRIEGKKKLDALCSG